MFAGGLLVALLAIVVELVLALVQRLLVSPGLRTERRATMARRRRDGSASTPTAHQRSEPDPSKPDLFAKVSPSDPG